MDNPVLLIVWSVLFLIFFYGIIYFLIYRPIKKALLKSKTFQAFKDKAVKQGVEMYNEEMKKRKGNKNR